MRVAWIMKYDEYGSDPGKKLKPTGRYKEVKGANYNRTEMFIEHQGLLFKSWVSEDDIEFLQEDSVRIFTCS